jgi:CubicO group peptidase (beta-lactamase class C family)
MKRRIFISTVTAAGIIAACKPGFAQQQAKTGIELNELLSVTEVPAIAVAGIIDGRQWQRVAGVKSITERVPVTADTLFPAASLSKPVFAWAVRDLVKQEGLTGPNLCRTTPTSGSLAMANSLRLNMP